MQRYLWSDLKTKTYQNDSHPHGGPVNGLEIRKLVMKAIHRDPIDKVQKLVFGKKTDKETKCIMLIGETGVGKSTLINNMVNRIFNVQFEDRYRFILIDDKDAKDKSQVHSQTDWITAYVFNHAKGMPFDYNYVLIDTPGFGDTRGIARDREMMEQLRKFLSKGYGIDSVDGVGFVAKSSDQRLTPTQKYVFQGLASMFGKDIQNNLYVLATHGSANKPPVLEALKEAKIQFTAHYKFDNSALFANNINNVNDMETHMAYTFSDLNWKMGYSSIEIFFKALDKVSPASLTLTKEVLNKRKQLTIIVYDLKTMIRLGLTELNNLQTQKQALYTHNVAMKGSKDFTIKQTMTKTVKQNLQDGVYVTNCCMCNTTCHYNCAFVLDSMKKHCCMMEGGYCTQCKIKGKTCAWDVHVNMQYYWVITTETVTVTLEELKVKYETSETKKLTTEQVVNCITVKIETSAADILGLIKEAQQNMKQLDAIALLPSPLSTKDYIDYLIQSETALKEDDYQARIEVLEEIKLEIDLLNSSTNVTGVNLLKKFREMMKDNQNLTI